MSSKNCTQQIFKAVLDYLIEFTSKIKFIEIANKIKQSSG